MTELQLIAKRQKYETSHILHLLLSVITAGFWIPVWVLVAVNNGIERGKIDRQLRKINSERLTEKLNNIGQKIAKMKNANDKKIRDAK